MNDMPTSSRKNFDEDTIRNFFRVEGNQIDNVKVNIFLRMVIEQVIQQLKGFEQIGVARKQFDISSLRALIRNTLRSAIQTLTQNIYMVERGVPVKQGALVGFSQEELQILLAAISNRIPRENVSGKFDYVAKSELEDLLNNAFTDIDFENAEDRELLMNELKSVSGRLLGN